MRKLLNTLYVTTPESYICRDGQNVVVKVDNIERFRIPVHNIESIVTFGYMGVSPSLLSLCADNNVAVTFLSPAGRFCGRVSGPIKGNVLLRRQQYRVADNVYEKLTLAKLFIAAKIASCRNVTHRVLRDHGNEQVSPKLSATVRLLELKLKKARNAQSIENLRGIEGDAASDYFGVFNHFIVAQKEDFIFNGRNRRPPRDNVNALLSFCYTLLAHEVQAALETVGLDPYVGFLHTDRPGRPSLALDLMEELRPYMADRLVLNLINRKQVNGKGFFNQEGFGVVMNEQTRKEVIAGWQQRKQDEITHPYLNEKIPIGLIPYAQAMLLARYIRGDIDMYPPFIMK
jgi:CRISPR-associated protein Cas1